MDPALQLRQILRYSGEGDVGCKNKYYTQIANITLNHGIFVKFLQSLGGSDQTCGGREWHLELLHFTITLYQNFAPQHLNDNIAPHEMTHSKLGLKNCTCASLSILQDTIYWTCLQCIALCPVVSSHVGNVLQCLAMSYYTTLVCSGAEMRSITSTAGANFGVLPEQMNQDRV